MCPPSWGKDDYDKAKVKKTLAFIFLQEMEDTAMAKIFTTLDIYLASFLSLYNLEPKLETRGGKVLFALEATADLYRIMTHFNEKAPVPVGDFVTVVKVLRGKMLTMKEGIERSGKGARYGNAKQCGWMKGQIFILYFLKTIVNGKGWGGKGKG